MRKFEDRNLDVLQNIEFGIVAVYRADASLLDIDAKDAIDALIRHYHAEEENRTPPVRRLADRAEKVFQSVLAMCEWRMGRDPGPLPSEPIHSKISLADLIDCLRKIQKSIPKWSGQGGRKGYLDFIGPYLP